MRIVVTLALLAACQRETGDVTSRKPIGREVTHGDELVAGRQIIAIVRDAARAAEVTPDCAVLGAQLAPLHDQLARVAGAHPTAIRALSEPELEAIDAPATLAALARQLPRCWDEPHVKQLAAAVASTL